MSDTDARHPDNTATLHIPTYRCRHCGHEAHGSDADAAANAESVRMAETVVSASEAYRRLGVIEYLVGGDNDDGPRASGKTLARLVGEQTDTIRECLRAITGTDGDAGKTDAAVDEMRRRLEAADRISRSMAECGRRRGGHRFEGDYCSDCGRPRWDLTNEEREASRL